MVPRKRLAPNNGAALRSLNSEFAYQPFPKANEKPSIATWSSPGRGQNGESVSGGTYRATIIRRQHGTRAN